MQYDLGNNYKVCFLALPNSLQMLFFSSVVIMTSGKVNGQLRSWELKSGGSIPRKFIFWGRIAITFSSLNLIRKRKAEEVIDLDVGN